MSRTRFEYIDVLKVIGLLCVILAHVQLPKELFMIRTFDVVLLILISGYLGLYYYRNISFFKYLKKRVKRLVLPTWIFLIIYFVIWICLGLNISTDLLIKSYALSNIGIGYVWIIRIYLLVSLFVPLYKYIAKYISDNVIFIIAVVIMIFHEILCSIGIFNNDILDYFFAYMAPCFLLLCVSHFIFTMTSKKILITSFVSFALCILIGYVLYVQEGSFQSPQVMKYPFRTYYLSYGIAVSLILICIVRNEKVVRIWYNKFIRFISEHSLWIYLWHMLAILVLDNFGFSWYINYVLIVIFAIGVTYFQIIIVRKLKKILKYNNFLIIFDC